MSLAFVIHRFYLSWSTVLWNYNVGLILVAITSQLQTVRVQAIGENMWAESHRLDPVHMILLVREIIHQTRASNTSNSRKTWYWQWRFLETEGAKSQVKCDAILKVGPEGGSWRWVMKVGHEGVRYGAQLIMWFVYCFPVPYFVNCFRCRKSDEDCSRSNFVVQGHCYHWIFYCYC